MGSETKLSEKQEAFAQALLVSESASEAYRKAYPNAKKYSAKSVHECASRLMANVKVAARIEELKEQRRQRAEAEAVRQGITPEQIVREQACSAFFDPASIFDADGRLLPLHKMPEQARRAVKSVKIKGIKVGDDSVEGVVAEIQLNDKLKALRDIGDHLGMYKQVHEHHWIEDLKTMTEDELEREEQMVRAELERALQERQQAGLNG